MKRSTRVAMVISAYVLAIASASYSYSQEISVDQAIAMIRSNQAARIATMNAPAPSADPNIPGGGVVTSSVPGLMNGLGMQMTAPGIPNEVDIIGLRTAGAGDQIIAKAMATVMAQDLRLSASNANGNSLNTGVTMLSSMLNAHLGGQPGSFAAEIATGLVAGIPGLPPSNAVSIVTSTTGGADLAPGARMTGNGGIVVVTVKGEIVGIPGSDATTVRAQLMNPSVTSGLNPQGGNTPAAPSLEPGQTVAQAITQMVQNGAAEGAVGAFANAINADPKVVAEALLAAGVPPARVVAELTNANPPTTTVDATGAVHVYNQVNSSRVTDSQIQIYNQAVIDAVVSAAPSFTYANAIAAAVSAGADPSRITAPSAAGNAIVNAPSVTQNQPIAQNPISTGTPGVGTTFSATPSSAGTGTGVSKT